MVFFLNLINTINFVCKIYTTMKILYDKLYIREHTLVPTYNTLLYYIFIIYIIYLFKQ